MELEDYFPPRPWHGRSDEPQARMHQCMQYLNLHEPLSPKGRAYGFLGFPSDEGVRRNQGKIGAKQGPQALRHALANLPIPNTNITYYDCGDIACMGSDLESAQHALAQALAYLFKHKIHPIILGGGA